MVEHPAVNRQVVGSSPTLGANCAGVAELADAQDLKSCDVNSSYRFDSGPRHQFLGPMVKRLRHRPFTAVTRVRIPVGSPLCFQQFIGYIWAHSSVGRASALQAGGHRFEPYCAHQIRPGSSAGQNASLSRQRSWVRVPSRSPINTLVQLNWQSN